LAGLVITAGLVTSASNELSPSTSFRHAVPLRTSTAEFVYWKPGTRDRLQIQFTGLPMVLQKDVKVYDLDLFDTDKETVESIHKAGARVICYINAGAWEEWRPDAANYPKEIIGRDYSGWPGEKWLDIRRLDVLEPVLSARFDLCKQKGFDGVEPDNLDGYQNETGFNLNAADQLTFNKWLANMAHSHGMSIGLKNDPDQMEKLVMDFDFTVMEECLVSEWCDDALPFIQQGKAAYAVEYTDQAKSLSPYCDQARKLGVLPLLKHRDLDAWRSTCD
jgi:hypothetical protein